MYGGVIPELEHVHKHGVPAWVRREVVPSTLLLLCNIVSLQPKAVTSSTRDRTALFIEHIVSKMTASALLLVGAHGTLLSCSTTLSKSTAPQ